MSLGPIATVPASVTQATTETIPYGVDMTNALPAGGTISSPASKLVDLETGVVITLADAPVTVGNVVTQVVRGSVLSVGHSYRLTITFTAATSTVLTTATEIDCPV